MTTAVGRNVKLELATAFNTAKTVTAVTLASPGVATSAAHGMSNGGTVGWTVTVTAGMVQLDGQATRVYNRAANAFDLQGLNTAGFSAFTAGTVHAGVDLDHAVRGHRYQIGGGTPDQLDDTKLTDVTEADRLRPAAVGHRPDRSALADVQLFGRCSWSKMRRSPAPTKSTG